MSILVSGGAGYIGSHTCVELLNAGYDIVVADNYYNSCPEALKRVREITGKDFKFVEADMTDHAAVEKVFAENLAIYMQTKFFRFLLSLIKNTQNISRGVFAFVPILDFTTVWTDERLFAKYNITIEEQEFIDTLIRPM